MDTNTADREDQSDFVTGGEGQWPVDRSNEKRTDPTR